MRHKALALTFSFVVFLVLFLTGFGFIYDDRESVFRISGIEKVHAGVVCILPGSNLIADSEKECTDWGGTVSRDSSGQARTYDAGLCGGLIFLNRPFACIGYWMLTAFAFLLGLSGLLLNEAVRITVLSFGSWFSNPAYGLGSVIDQVWSVLRNVGNIILIFSMMFIGFLTILRVNTFGMRNALVGVLAAALLINFSLFFTKAIIDVSNYVTLQFAYQVIPSTGCSEEKSTIKATADCAVNISDVFMKSLGMGTVYLASGAAFTSTEQQNALLKNPNSFLVSLLGSILFAILAFTFLVAAFHIIGRFIAYLLLMATSPVAVLSFFLPPLKKYWDQWWTSLWSNSISLPAYFLLLWFVIKIIGSPAFQEIIGNGGYAALVGSPTGGAAAATTGTGRFISILVGFAIAVGLALLTLAAARRIGTDGGKLAVSTISKAARYTGAGLLARGTVGRVTNKINEGLPKTWIGSTALGDAIRKSTIGVVAGSKFGTKQTFSQAKQEAKTRKDVYKAAKRTGDIRTSLDAAIAEWDKGTKSGAQVDKGIQVLRSLSSAQLAALGSKVVGSKFVIDNATPNQFLAITDQKSDKFSDEEREKFAQMKFRDLGDKLKEADKAKLPDKLTTEDKTVADAVNALPDKIIEVLLRELDMTKYAEVLARSLKQEKFDAVQKSDDVLPTLKKLLKDKRTEYLKASLKRTGTPTDPNRFSEDTRRLGLGPKDMAKFANALWSDGVGAADLKLLVPKIEKANIIRELVDMDADRDMRQLIKDEVDNAVTAAGGTPGPRGTVPPTTNANIKGLHNAMYANNPGAQIFRGDLT